MEEVKTKICSKCGEEKPLTNEYWHKRSDRPSGYRSECKVCACRNAKVYAQTESRKKARLYYEQLESTKEQRRKISKKFREAHKEYYREYNKKYSILHKEDRKIRCKKYVDKLSNGYIHALLKDLGVKDVDITDELISQKRMDIFKRRNTTEREKIIMRRKYKSKSQKKATIELRDYILIKRLIRDFGIARKDITSEIILLKREQTKMHRFVKKIKEVTNHESDRRNVSGKQQEVKTHYDGKLQQGAV